MKKFYSVLGMLVLTTIATYATVTFDPATGKGFVGKGDVQLALGFNNAQMQNNAQTLVFTYISSVTYNITETWATGNIDKPVSLESHEITITTIRSINAVINYDARTHKQVDGFILTGFAGDPVIIGDPLPQIDQVYYTTYTWTDKKGTTYTTDSMPVDASGNLYTEGYKKAVLSVEEVSSTGGLFVNGVAL